MPPPEKLTAVPQENVVSERALRIAIIGCGARASNEAKLQAAIDSKTRLVAVADPDPEAAKGRLKKDGVDFSQTRFFPDADAMLEHAGDYDGIIIGTRCHLHTAMAIKAAATGLPLYLEKPVAVSYEELSALANAFRGREDSVVVGFPLRHNPVFRTAIEILDSVRLGVVNQVQCINNVSYGGCYYGNWYRNYNESQGLWLQKATHDFDSINLLMKATPVCVAATMSLKVYGGDRPHNLRCSACDRTKDCLESPQNLVLRGDSGGMNWGNLDFETNFDHWCAFSREIKDQDAGSAIILYDNGAHACYSQNFVARRSAGRRSVIITGYKATLEFDYLTGKLVVTDHHSHRVDRIEVEETDRTPATLRYPRISMP